MKKILSLVLCVLMIVGLFAGCNNEEPAGTTQGNEPAGTTAAPVGTTAPASTALDLSALPLVPEGEEVTITIGLQQNALTENYDTNDYTLWLEEQTGINLEFVYFASNATEATQQLNAMIAGNEKLPDILWAVTSPSDTSIISELGNDGYLVDLNPYFEEYGYYLWQAYDRVPEVSSTDQSLIFAYGIDPITGASYAFPSYSDNTVDSCICGFFNQDFLDALDMEMPTTVDELYDYLVAVRDNDPNGNGKKDEIPMVYRNGGYRADLTEWIINAFTYINDSYFFSVEDGELYVPYMTEEYREALKYMNKLYEEGLIYQGSWTMAEQSELKALAMPAEGPTICGVICGHNTVTLDAESPYNTSYVGWAPLEDATGKGGYAAMDAGTFRYNTWITTDCENPVLAFRLLDFMNCQESVIRQRYGTPGVQWEYVKEEGATSSLGFPAVVNVLDSTGYTSQNNCCWHSVQAVVRPSTMWSEAFHPETRSEASLGRTNVGRGIYNNFKNGNKPEEVFTTVVYNAEEQEVVNEYKKLTEDFMQESRALFISGAKDPNSDADWEAYLKAMEQEGVLEWLEAAQAAYDRMNG